MTTNNLKFTDRKSVLRTLVKNSFKAIENGSYELSGEYDYSNHSTINLKNRIIGCKNVPLITEIKFASPSKGTLLDSKEIDLEKIVWIMEKSGSTGISILAQPFLFNGSIDYILKSRKITTLPILMKDIIVSDIQIKAAKKAGADCILLIKTVFDNNLTEGSLERLAEYAKKIGLQVIVETHDRNEFREVVEINNKSQKLFDLIGINNRDLDTLRIDLGVTIDILSNTDTKGNLIISESGISNADDINLLRNAGADAFLVGTSLMENSKDMSKKIQELLHADKR